jgi:hypothetical protein
LSESTEVVSWWQALAEDPDYYTNTEEGQKELAEMIRKESERLIEELGKSVKRTKEVIFLSRFCSACEHYKQEGRRMTCNRWHVRLVKPFHGRPIWAKVPSRSGNGEKELVVEGIDWDATWKEISERVIEMATNMVNGGYPYFCYESK